MSVYRGNWRGMLGMGFVAFIAFSVAISTRPGDPVVTRAWTIGIGATVLVLAVVVIAWMATIRLELGPEGLAYRSMFGRRELFWVDVDSIHIEATSYSVHGLPLGTRRQVRLKLRDGKRLALGNSIGKTEAMISEMVRLTLPHLYQRMWAEFNTGREIDLGPVRLSRASGLALKGLFGYSSISLDEIASYEARDGMLVVKKKGALLASKVPLARIANLYPLLAVLDSAFGASPARAPATKPASAALPTR